MFVHTCYTSVKKCQCMIIGVQKPESGQRHQHEKAFVSAWTVSYKPKSINTRERGESWHNVVIRAPQAHTYTCTNTCRPFSWLCNMHAQMAVVLFQPVLIRYTVQLPDGSNTTVTHVSLPATYLQHAPGNAAFPCVHIVQNRYTNSCKYFKIMSRFHPHQTIRSRTQLRSPTFGNQENMLIHMAINFESWLRWSRWIHGTFMTTCLCTSSRGTWHPRKRASDGRWATCTCSMLTSIAAH